MSALTSRNNGQIEVWEEVSPQYGLTSGVYGASATGESGRKSTGYGETRVKAVVGLLETLEFERNDVPASPEVAAQSFSTPRRGDSRDLPQQFWDYLDGGSKIQAIKALRDATGMSLLSAKNVVDRIRPTGARTVRVAEIFQTSALHLLPIYSVIRVEGSLQDATKLGGYVFERARDGRWVTTGVEDEGYTSADIERHTAAVRQRWVVLYTPEAGL